jgi:single-stranded-DNA-specific exonuclease
VTGSKEAGVLKGSARSIESYDMFKSLHEFEELFVKFGGHPMAAGFSIKEENLEALRIGLNEKTDLTEEDFAARLDIDMVLELDSVDYRLIDELELMEPTGTSNERPVFKAEAVKLIGGRVLGKNHNFIKMNLLANDSYKAEGIRFMEPPESFFEELKASLGDDCYERFDRGERFDAPVNIVYKPKINEFMGTKTIQADMCAIRGANI